MARFGPRPVAQERCEAFGEDAIIEALENGDSLLTIAKRIPSGVATLHNWLHSDPERSARVQAAMQAGAMHYEEQALQELDIRSDLLVNPQIAGPLVNLAKERAQAAWRMASVRDPKRYSDRRNGDTFIDARQQSVRSLTIVGVPPRTQGGVVRVTGGGVVNDVGVPSPHVGVLDAPTDLEADAALRKLDTLEYRSVRRREVDGE